MKKELTSKEKLFCTYYSLDRNPREAAVKSGYMFAERSALKLLKRKEITDEISQLDRKRKATQADIAGGYYRLAFGCVSDAISLLFRDELTDKDIEEMDLFNISDIKRQKGGAIEIKFFDRLKAMDKLQELSEQKGDNSESSFYTAIEKGASALRDDFNE